MFKITKFLLNSCVVLLVTFLLLEGMSFLLFQFVVDKKYSYSDIQEDHTDRIELIRKKLQLDLTTQALYIFHPYLGYVGRPGAYPWGEKAPPFNAYGMLSVPAHPYPYKKNPGEFVVAVVGGSVADIFANQVEVFLRGYLQDQLGFDRKLVLINLATGGYKQPQQLFHLQYALLAGFEFDAVLNIDGFNDLVLANENVVNHINPIFPSGFHQGLMSKIQNMKLDFKTSKQLYTYFKIYESELNLLTFVTTAPFSYSVFLNLAGEVWTKYSISRLKKLKYSLIVDSQETLPQIYRGPLLKSNGQDPYEIVTEIWFKASRMLSAVCRDNNLLYIHVLQPNQYVEGSKPLSQEEKEVAINDENAWGLTAKKGYGHLIAKGRALKSAGIPFYDLTNIFMNSRETVYVDDCCHFGVNGNIMLAKKIAGILLDELKNRKEK